MEEDSGSQDDMEEEPGLGDSQALDGVAGKSAKINYQRHVFYSLYFINVVTFVY